MPCRSRCSINRGGRRPVNRTVILLLGVWHLGASGCSSSSVPATGNLFHDLKHEDPRVRVLAAKEAVLQNRRDLIPLLVDNLMDADGAVRMFSAVALRKLTGEDFGYNPTDPAGDRRQASERWREWLAAQNLQSVTTRDGLESFAHDPR